jgi:chromate transporter
VPLDVQTVAVVGYAAAGLAGGLLAPVVAFTPSFAFVVFGANRFGRIRGGPQSPCVPRRRRARRDRRHPRLGDLPDPRVHSALAIRRPGRRAHPAPALRRGVVLTLLCAGAAGALIVIAGGPLPH